MRYVRLFESYLNPDPATDYIDCYTNISAGATLEIVDLLGNVRAAGIVSAGWTRASLASLPSGVYIARILSPSLGIVTRKFVRE